MIVSFITGAIATGMLFLISLIIVVGIKTLYYTAKARFFKKTPSTSQPEQAKKQQIKRQPKTVRTIEIDPDLADKIYFKKSS